MEIATSSTEQEVNLFFPVISNRNWILLLINIQKQERATGLEYILGGGALRSFGSDFPTNRDVLRYYSQLWGTTNSVNIKETRAAEALEQFYHSKGIKTVCQAIMKKKIKREVGDLTRILKFKSKNKTAKNLNSREN